MSRKIEALQEAAAQKSQESLDRVEKALEKMIKQSLTINFKTVADTANVSTAYLYKTPEIRERIETLRDQQKNHSKPKIPPAASDNSKTVIINNLREEIKQLKAQIAELRKINETLTGRLYQLQNSEITTDNFKRENESLKLKIKELEVELEQCQSSLPPKVIPIVEATKISSSSIGEKIKEELSELGIKLNSHLSKVIKSKPESTVLLAISALKDQLTKTTIDNPGGWLARAIEHGWTIDKSIPQQKPTTPSPKIYSATEEKKETISLDKLTSISSIFKKKDEE